jgi:peptidoglycan/LPS O-acetylase OafA/YrhL
VTPRDIRDTNTLGRSLSTHLDFLRFGAAMVVFASHVALPAVSGGLLSLRPLIELADDAVMAFFVLSGFVIAYTARTRDRDLTDYTEARLARLYSVALPALIVTILADEIGMRLAPSVYAGLWHHEWNPLVQIGAAVTFTNELWYGSIRPFSDGPYWSLGYEFWYYVLFGIGFYLRPGVRWIAAALVCALVGPKILALLPLWLLGMALYRTRGRIPEWWMDWRVVQLVGEGYSRHLPSKYVTGILFACNIAGFAAIQHRVSLRSVERPIRWLAGMTFSLYLLHYPLLHLATAALPGEASSWPRAALVTGLVLLAIAALAGVTERKKREARRAIDAVGLALMRHWKPA